KPRGNLPAPHPGNRGPGRRGTAATRLVPARLIDEPRPRPLHLQAALFLRALPPRAIRALRLPRPDRHLPPVRLLHGPRPRDGGRPRRGRDGPRRRPADRGGPPDVRDLGGLLGPRAPDVAGPRRPPRPVSEGPRPSPHHAPVRLLPDPRPRHRAARFPDPLHE